jgi:LEA14-like dessication related protein
MEDPNINSQPQPQQPVQPPYLKFLEEKKKPIIFVIFVVIILLLVVFTTREPEATVTHIRVKEVTSTFITFEITLKVENGNIIGGTLNYLEADIFYNDEKIGRARTIGKYEIKAMGTSTLKVDLTINNLPSKITLLPKIRAKGTANITIFFLTFDKEIDETVRG